jgi:acyl carrier protein
MTPTIESRVCEIASSLFNVPAAELTGESSAETVEAWDSLQQLNLVLAVEQEFDVGLEPEDIERMGSIAGIVLVLDEKLGIGSGR